MSLLSSEYAGVFGLYCASRFYTSKIKLCFGFAVPFQLY